MKTLIATSRLLRSRSAAHSQRATLPKDPTATKPAVSKTKHRTTKAHKKAVHAAPAASVK